MGSTFKEEKKGVEITENTTKWLEKNLTQEEFRLVNKALENKMRPSQLTQGNLEISGDRLERLDFIAGLLENNLKNGKTYLTSQDIKKIRDFEKDAILKGTPRRIYTRVVTVENGPLTFNIEVPARDSKELVKVITGIIKGETNAEELEKKGVRVYSVDIEGNQMGEKDLEEVLPFLKGGTVTKIRNKRE